MRINELIIQKIKDRLNEGAEQYGEEIKLEDKRVMVAESLEEALDMAVYLSAAIIKIEYNYSRNLSEKEIKLSISNALKTYKESYPMGSLHDDVLSEGIINEMKVTMEKKYGIQGVET